MSFLIFQFKNGLADRFLDIFPWLWQQRFIQSQLNMVTNCGLSPKCRVGKTSKDRKFWVIWSLEKFRRINIKFYSRRCAQDGWWTFFKKRLSWFLDDILEYRVRIGKNMEPYCFRNLTFNGCSSWYLKYLIISQCRGIRLLKVSVTLSPYVSYTLTRFLSVLVQDPWIIKGFLSPKIERQCLKLQEIDQFYKSIPTWT